MISIYTSTLGRSLYLKRLLESISRNWCSKDFEHHIICQNNFQFSLDGIDTIYKENIIFHNLENRLSIGNVINYITPHLKGDHIMKLDDDSCICSYDFSRHVYQIDSLIPGCVFSPYPVGLIKNSGGVPGTEITLLYGNETDTYYAFRKVVRIGGFARICRKSLHDPFVFPDDHCEDTHFSTYCREHNILQYYLENGLIVEHQETSLGQNDRRSKNKI